MTRCLLFSAVCAAALSSAVWAEEAPAPTPDVAQSEQLDFVVVTANRSPQAARTVAAAVTVLTQTEIEASQAVVVTDLLARTPGVNVTRSGGPGSATTLNIRGAEGQHTVVLIDGVKLNDPTATQSAINLGNLMIGDIARIEVLRGAQSTLWGSQAVGGVVNLVTAEPKKTFEAGVDVEGGSFGTAYGRLGVGGKTGGLSWRLAGGYYTTDGFSAYAPGTEDDGYQNTSVSGRAAYAFSDAVSAEARLVWSDGKVDIDGFGEDTPEYSRTEETAAYLGLNFAVLGGRLKNRLAWSVNETDRDSFNPSQSQPMTFEAAGETHRYEYQGSLAVTDAWSAVFGLESERAQMRSRSFWSGPNPPFERGKTGVDSLYVQAHGQIAPNLTLTAGLRHDDHDTYGGHTLGQLGAVWALNDGTTLVRASWAQGFRAPGLYELYSEYGDLALDPEEFDSIEFGVEQSLAGEAATMSATYFRRESDNEIRFFSCSFGSTDPLCQRGGAPRFGYYDNVLRTQAQGIELIGAFKPTQAVSLNADYTWTEALNDSPGVQNGRFLPRRPEHMANLSATYVWPGEQSATVAVRHVGDSFENAANTLKIKAYTVVDLRAAWPVNDRFEVYGRIENLFDESYETVRDYGTAGRGGFVGVRARF